MASPFEKLMALRASLATTGLEAEKIYAASPRAGAMMLLTWAETAVLNYLDDIHQLPKLDTRGDFVLARMKRLLDLKLVPGHIAGKLHSIRKTGNLAKHEENPLSESAAREALRYAHEVAQWIFANQSEAKSGEAPVSPRTVSTKPSAPSDFEKFFHFRKYRAMGDTTW